MNFSGKGAMAGDKKLSTTKITSLNPNAAEFIPSSVKSPTGITSTAEVSPKLVSSTSTVLGKAALDRSQSLASNNSDEEAHKYWEHQLPDDITPDFKEIGDGDHLGIDNLLSSLSLNGNEASQFRSLPGNGFMRKDQHVSPQYTNGNSLDPKFRYPVSSYGDDLPLASLRHYSSKPWDKPILNNDHLLSKVRDAPPYHQKLRNGSVTGMMNRQQYIDIADVNPREFLVSQFPGFAVESLARAYALNGYNLNSTIEMLRQFEVDGGLNKNMKAHLGPVRSTMDFPALSTESNQNSLTKFAGENIHLNLSPYPSSEKSNLLYFKPDNSIPSGEAIGYASAVRQVAPQDTGLWKYENNRSPTANVGSSRSSPILSGSYQSGNVRGILGDRLQSHGSGQSVPTWPETGEAIANMYPEMLEEARDHARLRNSYIEQQSRALLLCGVDYDNKEMQMFRERQAYIAKELAAKEQLHHLHMKAAQEKAQESLYRQRNPVGLEIQRNGVGRVQERTIDLIGMHIGEALLVLKQELAVMRNAARSVDQVVHVYICVGSGNPNRGSQTPPRLPVAVRKYLLDDEGLDYSEPQPGVFRVVVY